MIFKNNHKINKKIRVIALGVLLITISCLMILPQKGYGETPDLLHQQALDIAVDIAANQPDIINAITSGQSDDIISNMISAYLTSIGAPIPPGLVSLVLNNFQSAGSIGRVSMTQTQEFKTPTLNQYKWEVGIPGFVKKGDAVPLEKKGVSSLIKIIIKWFFSLAGVFAFTMIVYAGFQYLVSGGNTAQQKDAQERIMNAIIGLVLLFAFYIILYTINPDILNTSL